MLDSINLYDLFFNTMMLLWINNLKGKESINSDKTDKRILLITWKTEISDSFKKYTVYVFQDYNYTCVHCLFKLVSKKNYWLWLIWDFRNRMKKHFLSS